MQLWSGVEEWGGWIRVWVVSDVLVGVSVRWGGMWLRLPQRGKWGGTVQGGVVGQHRTRVGHGGGGCGVVGEVVIGRGGEVWLGGACGWCVVW